MEVDTTDEDKNKQPELQPNVEAYENSKDPQENAPSMPEEPLNDRVTPKEDSLKEISADSDVNSNDVSDQNECKRSVCDDSPNASQKSETVDSTVQQDAASEPFKKPLVTGSKSKPLKARPSDVSSDPQVSDDKVAKNEEKKRKSSVISTPKRENSVPIPYTEPTWSSLLEEPYSLEVLKSGAIIENVDLSSKPFFVFGRQSNCDVCLGHPTISRHHAVLQHKAKSDDEGDRYKDAGLYIYDLGSTHGTFVNKQIIPKQRYIRLRVGYMVKFGGSTRSYIVVGPQSDAEAESEKSITELKEEALQKKLKQIEEGMSSSVKGEEEDHGVDWGLGEDADEETDLTENPFAATQNEELYLDDPKKTLRGWFEREGEELEYEVEEKSFGQFLCQVRLPVDDARGKPLVAEALVKGKKKEAVVQCALEACRILDRMGLLRQATHESKKRKARNWEEDDFYDSDEDTFLDRTGTVERKREKRMITAGKLKTKAETYESLLEKHQEVLKKIENTEKALEEERTGKSKGSRDKKNEGDEADTLDAFMSTLTDKSSMDKVNFRRLKVDLAELKQEEVHLSKLIKIACPVSMPGMPSSNVVPEKSQKDEAEKEAKEEHPSSFSSSTEEVAESLEEKVDEASDLPDKSEKPPKEIAVPKEMSEERKVDNDSGKGKAKVEEKVKTGIKRKIIAPLPRPDWDDDDCSEAAVASREKKEARKSSGKVANKEAVDEEDYSMWVPPENQSGDGRTKLNEKYGY
ncbi:kanadaptin [Ischnura elegans]|uniref:kanadaptin n=1 Tax=Ischnura elegans TaxID=197161 RepID=UPI001ED88546|nr:kanadaptin [Ischnura elegans]